MGAVLDHDELEPEYFMQGSDCYNNAPAEGYRAPRWLDGPCVVKGEDLGRAETPQQQRVAEALACARIAGGFATVPCLDRGPGVTIVEQ